MEQTMRWVSFLFSSVVLAATVGCGDASPAGSRDGDLVGTGGNAAGGSGGGTGGVHADAGGTGGSGGGGGTGGVGGTGGAGGAGGTGGAHIDAGGTGGSSGTGGTGGIHIDAGGTGGSSGTGGAQTDAGSAADGRSDAAGACPASANAKACVACCDALYPGGFEDAFFGNECLYCTAACGETRICRGVAGAGAKDVDGPCLQCAQPRLGGNCRFMSAPRCPNFIECLKRCPTN